MATRTPIGGLAFSLVSHSTIIQCHSELDARLIVGAMIHHHWWLAFINRDGVNYVAFSDTITEEDIKTASPLARFTVVKEIPS